MSASDHSVPPPLSSAILQHVASDWPEFAAVRASARALSHRSRLAQTISIAANEVRVSLASALLSSDCGARSPTAESCEDAARRALAEQRATQLYAHARAIVTDGEQPLRTDWHMSEAQVRLVRSTLGGVVGGLPATPEQSVASARLPTSPPRPERQQFGQSVHLFLAAVGQNMPLADGMRAFGGLGPGHFSHDDRCFYPDNVALGHIRDRCSLLGKATTRVIKGSEGEPNLTLFLLGLDIAAIVSSGSLRPSRTTEAHRASGGLESLPDFIALPRDPQGRPIIPESRVTALVEAREAWATELGELDAVSKAITQGRLVMPRVSAPSQQTYLRNHPSWESDDAAKAALGPVIAKWLASGVLEYVSWNDRMPILLQPCGAVPKGTAPFYRLITDARFANPLYSDWGVTYTTAAQLSSTLNRCDFHFSVDISDAYHLSLWAGCGGELRPTKRPIIGPGRPGDPDRITWVDALVNGCDPSTCKGNCDKDLSGIMIEGHVFRFAACQFGQKTAGSPLGSLVRSVARYFARLPTPVHIAAWVDDLIFIMSTPEHGDCLGFAGGCPVCVEYHGRAVAVQQLWVEKARRLNIPLSAKGHEVGQVGSFTGVGLDTFQGLFSMLPEKLSSLRTARDELAVAATSTARLIARVRGKAMHYACAIQYLAIAAASLSQLMHGRELGLGPVSVPDLTDEDDMEFDWDRPIAITDRARVALECMRLAVDRFGDKGQPLWPLVPSSFHGAFLAGEAGDANPLIITYDASVFGWGAIVRTSPGDTGVEIVGGFRPAEELLGRAYLEPTRIGDSPASQVYRETLAGFLATRAASQRFALADYTVVIRGDCVGALTALRKGSFKSPALQNVAILHNQMLITLGVRQPLYLHAPGTVMKAEGIDGLSREVASARRELESLPALRDIVCKEAERFGTRITIDLFAAVENTLVPRFFARYPEPAAEAVDALAQPDWGRSLCPHCRRWHRETVFAYPPMPLLERTLAKARADGARGVLVVPFTPSHPTWPVLEAASLTHVEGQFNRCVIVPNNASYVRTGEQLESTQRLAVMAVDFSPRSNRATSGLTEPCPSARDHRPLASRHGAQDSADRDQIAAALRRLGLAGRPGWDPISPDAGPRRSRTLGPARPVPY